MKAVETVKKTMARLNTDQDVRDAVIDHEARFAAFGSRLDGVEDGLKVVHRDVSAIKTDMNSGFAQLSADIKESKASRGPGWIPVIGAAAGAVTIAGFLSYAVMTLVLSNVGPSISGLEKSSSSYQREFDARVDEARQELTAMRNKERERLREDIDSVRGDLTEIREKIGWLGKVEKR